MTTRHSGYIVTLKRELREDDAEVLIAAIRLLEPVASVEAIEANHAHHTAKEMARFELRARLWDALEKKET